MGTDDAYIAYTKAFFKRWVGLYDLFASSIWYAYREGVRELEPCAGKSVLDICCGTGEIALRAAAKGASVTGVDISSDMMACARKKAAARGLNITFRETDARELPFEPESFDRVILSFALHDMPRPVRILVLQEANRVCAERLVVLDYDLTRTGRAAALISRCIALFESAYFKNFIRETAEPLFKEAGLPPPRKIAVSGPLFTIYILEKPTQP